MAKFKKFTDVSIAKLKQQNARYVVTEGEGLYLEVSPKGLKVWKHLYKVAGKNRWYKFGTYPAMLIASAREENQRLKRNTDQGRPPVNTVGLNGNSPFIDVFEEWQSKAVSRKGRPWSESYKRNIRQMFKNDVLPYLEGYKIKDVHRTDLQAVLDLVLKRNANSRALQLYRSLSRLLNYAAERGYINTSPMIHMTEVGSQGKKSRFLDSAEIKVFIESLSDSYMAQSTAHALELILRTGQRPSEVCGATIDEMQGDWWVIPGTRTKNGLEQRVPLIERIKGLFGEANEHGLFFPSMGDPKRPIASTVLSKGLRRSLTGHEKVKDKTVTIPIDTPFTPHDLRRTCATHLGELGFMDEIIGAVLNHKKQGITGSIYNQHTYDSEKQKAMLAWERKLQRIITGDNKGKVVNIK